MKDCQRGVCAFSDSGREAESAGTRGGAG
jgi:hypothetical protein